ncbi:hypothetical protein EHS25_010022 [Saitozyma podzolica]|uniref:Cholesterol 7-alpha-monooxygenase n=1 Tax=Saitozyma podzolica TaxID=1890683 RepID=A0A427YIB8_9TREE|nr:hypothetical protein EHS25_010022 [Saitozyma podzolica]
MPFLGSALSMTKGDAFWRDTAAQYGPVFRARVMGETRIFVTTTPVINYVYKNSSNFDFFFFRKFITATVFGMSMDNSFHPAVDSQLFPGPHRAMQPGAIAGSITRYADLLEVMLPARLEGLRPDEGVDLANFAFDLIYTASSKAFFSSSFPSAATKEPFVAFDQAFPLLNLGKLPSFAKKPAEKARETMLSLVEEWWDSVTSEERETLAPALMAMVEVAEAEAWPKRDVAALLLGDLWALEANAPNGAIWAIAEILRHPHILPTLRSEIDNAISRLDPPHLSTLLHLPQSQLVLTLPELNACFQETLRLYTDSFSLRVVQKDCVVCVSRPNAVSPESEWGVDAPNWDHTRFLDGRAKGVMNPFGGGVSMCEGRHFASAEILTFIASFITLADVTVTSDTLMPDAQRVGLGMLQPTGTFKVRIASRSRG